MMDREESRITAEFLAGHVETAKNQMCGEMMRSDPSSRLCVMVRAAVKGSRRSRSVRQAQLHQCGWSLKLGDAVYVGKLCRI